MRNIDDMDIQETLNIVAKNIKHYRVLKDISQTNLGLKSNVAPNYITYIESASRDFHISTLIRISKGLNIPISELFVDNRKEYLSKPRIDKK